MRWKGEENMWFIFALLSAIFAALTSILAKIGMDGVNSDLATAIRTVVVVITLALAFIFLHEEFKPKSLLSDAGDQISAESGSRGYYRFLYQKSVPYVGQNLTVIGI